MRSSENSDIDCLGIAEARTLTPVMYTSQDRQHGYQYCSQPHAFIRRDGRPSLAGVHPQPWRAAFAEWVLQCQLRVQTSSGLDLIDVVMTVLMFMEHRFAGQTPPVSPPPNRISSCQNPVDQRCYGGVVAGVIRRFRHIRMCEGCILQDAEDFALWQNVPVVQRQQQRLDDRKRGGSGNIHGVGHHEKPFQNLVNW